MLRRLTALTVLAASALCAAPATATAASALDGSGLPVELPALDVPGFPDAQDQLSIRFQEAPGAEERVSVLRCHPVGGSHTAAQSACDTLDRQEDPFAPVSSDTMCTRVYGGSQTAKVSGVWKGQPVNATFSRSGGCEIARWDALVPVLPAVR